MFPLFNQDFGPMAPAAYSGRDPSVSSLTLIDARLAVVLSPSMKVSLRLAERMTSGAPVNTVELVKEVFISVENEQAMLG